MPEGIDRDTIRARDKNWVLDVHLPSDEYRDDGYDGADRDGERIEPDTAQGAGIDEPGIIGVAGPNGAGKTTLIHCLLGLVQPTNGMTRINDTSSRAFDASDRARIGYMPQHEPV